MDLRSIAALVVALGACGSGKAPPPPPAGPVRVFSDAELAAYETALLARVAENKSLVCKRPLLRGTPGPGNADADLVAFVEPSGALADCARDALKLEDAGAKTREVVAARTPAVLEIEKRCGPLLEAAIGKAIAHEDACSPYAAGRRVEPPEWTPTMLAAYVLGLRAQLRAESGDPVGAMWLVAESVRMFQDLGRGQPFLLPPVVGTAATSIVLEASQPIVDKLTREQAAELVPVFDALVASEPRFGAVLRGEAQYMGLYMGLANLKGNDWVPPGGTRPDVQKANALANDSALHPLDEAGVLVGTSEMIDRDVATACPLDATYKACFDGLQALVANATPPETDQATLLKSLADKTALADTPAKRESVRIEVRQRALEVASNEARSSYVEYVAKRATGVGRLTATRIALGVRQTGTCPTEAPMIPVLGDALVFERDGQTLTIRVPAWAVKRGKPEAATVRTIQCP